MLQFFLLFTILSLLNVIFATYKSIITVKEGILAPALVNGLYFMFYNVVLIYTVMDVPLWLKCLITFGSNVIGVAFVKWLEKKFRKDKMWKFELTAPSELTDTLHVIFNSMEISHSYIEGIGKYTIFNCYCPTQKESAMVKDIVINYRLKYFVSESENA